jgi:GNAT superfamily N-acetyltransferase
MLTLRPAVPSDAALILQYIRELAEYEQLAELVVATREDIERFVFSDEGFVKVTMAEWAGRPAGFALWFLNFSTFEGKPGIYLEDLFVRPEFRRHGIGRALLRHLAGTAAANGWTRFVWQVLDWNAPAIEFYESQGATPLRQWITCRVEGDAIRRLAERAD